MNALADRLEPDAARLLRSRCRMVRLPAGSRAFHAGDACGAWLWVTRGTVRVQVVSEAGRERVLYRVTPGASCVLTTSCLFEGEPYAAEGVCETDVEAIAMPASAFRELLGLSETFRDLVLADYARRVGDMLVMLEAATTQHVGERLAAYLADRGSAGPVTATHQDIAAEIGTAREVVSRALKDLERRGLVALARGRIEILDAAALGAAVR